MKRIYCINVILLLSACLLSGCSKESGVGLNEKDDAPLLIGYEAGSYTWDANRTKLVLRIFSGSGDYEVSGFIRDENVVNFEDFISVTFQKDRYGEYCEMKLLPSECPDGWRAEICITDRKSGQKETLTISSLHPIYWI